MHRLCALVFVLSSCVSVQAQNWSIEKGFYFDDDVGQIVEPSAVSSQALASEPEISTIGSTTKNPSTGELASMIERILDEAMQVGESCAGHALAPIQGAEKTRSADNLSDDAGELTASVEQSRPAQIITSKPMGLSNPAEAQVLNTSYQDLE